MLTNEMLLTDSVQDPRYPSRLSRNIQFAKAPMQKLVEENPVSNAFGFTLEEFKAMNEESQVNKEETKPTVDPRIAALKNRTKTALPDINADKIFSPMDILTQKLQSGEITKYCI